MEHIHDCTSCSGNCHSCGGCGEPAQNAGHLQETQLATETIYDGRILRVTNDTVRLENGKTAPREVIHHPGGACIVPLTDSLEVLMVRQFRYPHNEITLEIPAGKLEYGEDPKTCAIRELKEEVGATAAQVYSLGCLYPTPAYDKEVIHMYLATGLQFAEQTPDEDEFLDVVKLPLAKVVDMIMDNKLPDAKTQIALLKTVQMMSTSG
ncbi:MAG: NUDIX hydrolase [Oscillospiraceae bacterium]|nr:NUDIX hydrolase [Oscillospiraceae bacterium]